jgi:malonyl-ACP decarboxylase
VAADLSPMDIQGFHAIGAMGGRHFANAPEKACRPFDARHEGFIYGQASACLVLESDISARARGASALARYRGGAILLHGTASPAPDASGEARAMAEALKRSGLHPEEIVYLNTHGSSSPAGDTAEIEAIARVFGAHFPNLWLNATKGLTGHCLHAAGVVEAVACVVQMADGFLHPNANLETPISPSARFCGTFSVSQPIATAMSNSFGFGGINTSLVLTREPPP